MHAYGAAFDNPDLLVCCVVGDGEAETGPLAASWHSNKFVDPERDGVVLPILHLNGYKIANSTVLARIPDEELRDLMRGYGHEPYVVEGDVPEETHQRMAATLDEVLDDRVDPPARRRASALADDRPPHAEGLDRTEGGRRPPDRRVLSLAPGAARAAGGRPRAPRRAFERWLRSHRPDELFDDDGTLREEPAALAPRGERRHGVEPACERRRMGCASSSFRTSGITRSTS